MMTAGTHGAPKAKINSVNPCLRFIGLIPIATDWHIKLVMRLDVELDFLSVNSSPEHGSLSGTKDVKN